MASWNGVPLNSASLGIVSPREVGRKERAFQGLHEIRRVKDRIKIAQPDAENSAKLPPPASTSSSSPAYGFQTMPET